MVKPELLFENDTVRLDKIYGLFCEEDGYAVKTLDTVSSDSKSQRVDSSCMVSRRRGRTFPYIFVPEGDAVVVKVRNPTIGLELNGETLVEKDEKRVESDSMAKIGDISFKIQF